MPASLGQSVSKRLSLVVEETKIETNYDFAHACHNSGVHQCSCTYGDSVTHAIFYVYTNAHVHIALLLDTLFKALAKYHPHADVCGVKMQSAHRYFVGLKNHENIM